MKESCRVTFLSLLITVLAASASAHETGGPSFDPTPVQIPEAAKTSPRPVTNMDLLTIRDLHGLSISPDGKYVAFVVGQAVFGTNSYRTGLFVAATESSSPPVCLGTAGLPQWDPINQWMEEAPQWSSDSQYIMRRMRMSGVEKWQVWRWNRDGGPPVQLTHVRGDIQSYDMAPDRRKMLLTVQQPRDQAEIQRLVMDGVLYDGSYLLIRGGGILPQLLAQKPSQAAHWIHEFATGDERRASPEEMRAFGPWESDLDEKVFNKFDPSPEALEGHHIIDAKVSPDRRFVAYRFLPKIPGQSQDPVYLLFTKPVRGGSPARVQLPPDAYFIMDYWWSSDSKTLYYVYVDDKGHTPRVMAAAGATIRQVFHGSDFLLSWSADQNVRYLACRGENARQPSKLVLIDLGTGGVRTLVDLNPEFDNIQLSEPIRIEGTNKFGDAWFAHLVRPLNYEPGKRYPTILTTYRSGDYFLRGASGDENPIQVYAAYGFAVLSFDYGRDTSVFSRAENFQDFLSFWSSPIDSMEMAVQKGVEMGIVDPGKVGVSGYSRGTEQVGFAITHTALFKAASGAAGDSSPFFYNMASDRIKKRFANWGLGGWPEGQVRSRWKEFAPDLNADRIQAPVLNNDPDSEFISDLSLYTALRELGKPVELFIYPDELHHINQPRHRYQIYERNLDWFRFWLKSEESVGAHKTEQYARWNSLRELQKKVAGTIKTAPEKRANE
jgi:dipeptidyl aminopeptidase/acylaminoacyl peptidase